MLFRHPEEPPGRHGALQVQVSQHRDTIPPRLAGFIERRPFATYDRNAFTFPVIPVEEIAAEKTIRLFKTKTEDDGAKGNPRIEDLYDIGFLGQVIGLREPQLRFVWDRVLLREGRQCDFRRNLIHAAVASLDPARFRQTEDHDLRRVSPAQIVQRIRAGAAFADRLAPPADPPSRKAS